MARAGRRAYSRYAETPRHLILELNAEGTDYVVRTDAAGSALVQPWPELRDVLAHTTNKLTQQTILERWPAEGSAPARSTLSRWLKRATQQGMICCSGSGYRGDPFVYWLPVGHAEGRPIGLDVERIRGQAGGGPGEAGPGPDDAQRQGRGGDISAHREGADHLRLGERGGPAERVLADGDGAARDVDGRPDDGERLVRVDAVAGEGAIAQGE